MKGTATSPLRGLVPALALCALLVTTATAATTPVPISAVQVDETGSLVRLTASGTPTASISRLNNPIRTVVDLSPAKLAIAGSGTISVPVASSTITRVRLGQYQSNTVRVVIDHPSDFGLKIPTIDISGESIAIGFGPGGISLPNILAATEPAADESGLPAPSVLTDLPLSVTPSGDGTTVLFKFPEAEGYTVWLERFPNRLVFETPARPEGTASASIRYELGELALVETGSVKDVRIYHASEGGYTKVVCYLTDFATWTDKLTEEGISVSLTPTEAPAPRSGQADVAFSGRDWRPADAPDIEADTTPPTGGGGTMSDDPGIEPVDLTEPSFRITSEEATDGSGGGIAGQLEHMGGQVSGKLEMELPGDSDHSGGDEPMHTFMTPAMPEVVPMADLTAPDLYLFKGESVIIPVSNLVRTSIGDPEALTVNVLSQSELLVTAKAPGRTSLITWETGKGRTIRTVSIDVSQAGRAEQLSQVLADRGIRVSYVADKTVVLEGTVTTEEERARAELIAAGAAEKVVNLLEISNPNQFLVKVRIVELNNRDKEDILRQLGTGTQTESGDFSFSVLSDIFDPAFPGGGLFNFSLRPGIVNNENIGDQLYDPIDFMLNAVETERRGRILSQPNLVTMSGHEASFRVGGEVPYTFRNENGFNVVDFREFGIELVCTPYADSAGNITVKLAPTVRTVDNSLAVAGIPGFRTRTVSTQVQLQNRQTLVIGGLIQREISEQKAAVPFLSDIPLIGSLFRSKSSLDDETELLVFLTPIKLEAGGEVLDEMNSEDDVHAGGVMDERYTFYGEGAEAPSTD